ncbi:hypothetical protein L2E82_36077 [Cichorium intybus]|uniref:Uncharacterized protein n=1 Tax=Cichorium intybus TaxID=13427 RepID=A0ACB9BQM4_CICIN|nr:hypothetical protein L2E82_36077 [Cichorium intybus]
MRIIPGGATVTGQAAGDFIGGDEAVCDEENGEVVAVEGMTEVMPTTTRQWSARKTNSLPIPIKTSTRVDKTTRSSGTKKNETNGPFHSQSSSAYLRPNKFTVSSPSQNPFPVNASLLSVPSTVDTPHLLAILTKES